MPHMCESVGGQGNRKCHIARWAWVIIRVGFKRDFEPVILADQVLTIRVYVGERTSVLCIESNGSDTDALFPIILDQPGFVLAPLWRQSHTGSRDRHLICDGCAILKA